MKVKTMQQRSYARPVRFLVGVIFVAAALFSACGGEDKEPMICAPGENKSCLCIDGDTLGTQECAVLGNKYYDCRTEYGICENVMPYTPCESCVYGSACSIRLGFSCKAESPYICMENDSCYRSKTDCNSSCW